MRDDPYKLKGNYLQAYSILFLMFIFLQWNIFTVRTGEI
jgi:hypothetical protein